MHNTSSDEDSSSIMDMETIKINIEQFFNLIELGSFIKQKKINDLQILENSSNFSNNSSFSNDE